MFSKNYTRTVVADVQLRWLTRGVGVETILYNRVRHNRILKWDIARTFIGDDLSDPVRSHFPA